jgi:hypothetical protein
MSTFPAVPRRIILFTSGLVEWIDEFLLDSRARNLDVGANRFYRIKLPFFNGHCASMVRNSGCRYQNSA